MAPPSFEKNLDRLFPKSKTKLWAQESRIKTHKVTVQFIIFAFDQYEAPHWSSIAAYDELSATKTFLNVYIEFSQNQGCHLT